MTQPAAHRYNWPDMPDDWQANPQTVDIFAIDLAHPPITWQYAHSLLDESERQRVDRFKSPQRQREFAITRTVLRMVIASIRRIAPQQVTFEHNAQGKPFLFNHPVYFNVTHSHEIALIAICLDMPLGVDIEHIHDRENFGKLAKRFFAPGEYDALIALPPDIQLLAFHAIWTRKEAFVKATAKGIALGLDQFEVNVDPSSPATLKINHPAITDTWLLTDLTPPVTGYAACLCVADTLPSIRCWQLSPA